MTSQMLHSKLRLCGPIPNDIGVKEEEPRMEVKKAGEREEDMNGDGVKAGEGDLAKRKGYHAGDFGGGGGASRCVKSVSGNVEDMTKTDLDKNIQTIYDSVPGKLGKIDIVLSDSEKAAAGFDFISFSETANQAVMIGDEKSVEADFSETYDMKNMPGKAKDRNLRGARGRKCDKKCVQKCDGNRIEGKPVAKVTRRRKTCWRNVPLADPYLGSSSSCASSSTMSIFFLLVEKMVVMAVLVSVFSAITNVPVICAESTSFDKEIDPVFLEPVPNVTVAVGRDASLTCAVDHLGLHKVAWIHLDRQMIVSIHNHVITRQPRFTVTHDSHKTWTLHVTKVTEEDRGHYMCQVNTKPMISQTGFLQVVVPPNIVDKASSKSNIVVREKEDVTLECRGEGFPLPQIKWRREDSQTIETSDGREVHQLDGPKLVLRQVSRTHMGAYLCIASNGVPPSVSKRITLDVEFAPQMHVPNQLLGSPVGTEVHLECFVEAHPKAITYWEFLDAMVMNSSRVTTRAVEDRYKIHMTLTIRELQDSDFGMYKCISKNSIAETDGSITLNKTKRPTSPPQTMLHGYDDEDNPYRNRGRQGRKEQRMKQLEETRKRLREEDEKRREKEESRRRAQEMERQRLKHDFDRGQRNEQATRVTHTQSGSSSSLFADVPLLLTRYLLASYLLSWLTHI